jgi:ABC-type multidrug transport system fused ATPase/permease subunit
MRKLAKLTQKKLADANGVGEASIGSMRTVKAFGAEESEMKHYQSSIDRYLELTNMSAGAYLWYERASERSERKEGSAAAPRRCRCWARSRQEWQLLLPAVARLTRGENGCRCYPPLLGSLAQSRFSCCDPSLPLLGSLAARMAAATPAVPRVTRGENGCRCYPPLLGSLARRKSSCCYASN